LYNQSFRQWNNNANDAKCLLWRAPKQSRLHSQNTESNNIINNTTPIGSIFNSIKDYLSLMRPITIIQAVGAYIVGILVILRHNRAFSCADGGQTIQNNVLQLLASSLSIYLSYGAGMAMNDCTDATLDKLHDDKCDRAIASGRISGRNGWMFCWMLSILSMIFARISTNGIHFMAWNGFNLLLMAGYALGLQKIFLVKNFICGWLAVSPLVGASLFSGMSSNSSTTIHKLYQLAAIGFPLQVAREILKDIQDVESDRGNKDTLPLYIGEINSKRIAYGIVGLINIAMITLPYYWNMFASKPRVYAISLLVGVPMCVRASMLPILEGQVMLKKSISVLLLGMIGGLLLQ
jgi:4-hydroxybenzoate polyprenyltransferase